MRDSGREHRLTTADVAAATNRPEQGREREHHGPRAPVTHAPERVEAGRPSGADDREWRAAENSQPALLTPEQSHELRVEWIGIQGRFVDEPRQAVQAADHLVAETIKRLADSFAAQRANLERQWDRGDEVNTEDLRQTLRRYRSFFDRLLSM